MTAETATTPDEEVREPEINETDEITQHPHEITIRGVKCELKRLRTREFLKMTRIISEGMGGRLALMAFDEDEDEAVMAGKLAGMLVNSIPYAGEEVIEFIKAMVVPDTDDPREYEMVRKEMEDPELEVLSQVIIGIVDAEIENLVGLGKAFAGWWRTANLGERIRRQVEKGSSDGR